MAAWKIVRWVENGTFKHEAFILNQRDELTAAGPLEMSFVVPVGVTEPTMAEIEGLTDVRFKGIA